MENKVTTLEALYARSSRAYELASANAESPDAQLAKATLEEIEVLHAQLHFQLRQAQNLAEKV